MSGRGNLIKEFIEAIERAFRGPVPAPRPSPAPAPAPPRPAPAPTQPRPNPTPPRDPQPPRPRPVPPQDTQTETQPQTQTEPEAAPDGQTETEGATHQARRRPALRNLPRMRRKGYGGTGSAPGSTRTARSQARLRLSALRVPVALVPPGSRTNRGMGFLSCRF